MSLHKIKDRYRKLLYVINYQFEETEEVKRRVLYNTHVAYVILGVTLLIVAHMNYKASVIAMAYTSAVGGVIAIITAILGMIFKNRRFIMIGGALITIILFTYWGISGGNNGFALVWLTLIPFAGMFALGLGYGTLLSLYFALYLFFIFYSPVREVVAISYTDLFMDRFPFLFAVASIVAFLGVYSLKKTNIQVEEQRKEMERLRVEAEAANKAKSEFLANISHEIRTPINIVLGMNELILRESGNNDITNYASSIETSGKHLLSLINDVLDVSKVESGKMELVPEKYYFEGMINDVITMATASAEEKGLALNVGIQEEIPSVLYGDEVRVRQIIMNLLSNAIKYTEKGEINLEVSHLIENGRCKLFIIVSDTGRGIKESEQKNLFESFVRLSQRENKNIVGTGLGLSLVKSFVEMMDGEVSVKSKYGKGSQFIATIYQDIVDYKAVGKVELGKIEPVYRGTTITADGVHLLVVDDVEANCMVVKGLLKGSGIIIDDVNSGETAVEICNRKKFDLILMDHMMYGMDGIETLAEVRKSSLNSTTPVIVLTANAIAGNEKLYRDVGFDGFLSKPVMPAKLDNAILTAVPDKVSLRTVAEDDYSDEMSQEETDYIKYMESSVPGLHVFDAIEQYAGTLEFYIEMLTGVFEANRMPKMIAAYKAGDFASYRMETHTLKGMVRSVGMYDLAKSFEMLQLACDNGDAEYINQNHGIVVEEYDRIMEAICGLKEIGKV